MTKTTKFASVKLTKATKDAIVDALVTHRFRDQVVNQHYIERALFFRAYDHAFPEDQRKAMVELEIKYPGSFGTTNRICVAADGMTLYLGGTTENISRVSGLHLYRLVNAKAIGEPVERPVPAKRTYGDGYKHSERFNLNHVDGSLLADTIAFIETHRKLQAEIATAYTKANAAVHSFSTGRALATGWPEIVPLIEHMLPVVKDGVATPSLPAVQISALNTAFHLPPEKTAAA